MRALSTQKSISFVRMFHMRFVSWWHRGHNHVSSRYSAVKGGIFFCKTRHLSSSKKHQLSSCYHCDRLAHIQDPVLDGEAQPEVQVEPRLRQNRLHLSRSGCPAAEHRNTKRKRFDWSCVRVPEAEANYATTNCLLDSFGIEGGPKSCDAWWDLSEISSSEKE